MLPSQFVALDENEKAFVIACIDIRVENEEKQKRELESKKK